MSAKAKIITASCAAAALLIGLIASACAPVRIVVQTPVVVGQQTAQPANTGTAANPAVQPAAAQPAAEPEKQNAAADPAPASQNEPAAQPSGETAPPADGSLSTEEIVTLYNTAVNKVKQEATNLTRNYKHVSAPEDQLELPSAIQGLGKTAIGTFVKGTDTPESWTSKEDMQIVFPVGNTDYSSHLTADMVETATCEDTGDSYQITLKLYDDKLTSPEKGEGYAGVFNTTTASTFTEINIPTVTFNRVDINGVNGSITCTIDKTAQRVTEITFANTDILKLEVKVVVATLNVKLALAVEENYSIAY